MTRPLPAALFALTVLGSLACGGLDAGDVPSAGVPDGDVQLERYGRLARVRSDDGKERWIEVDGASDEAPAGDTCAFELADTVTAARGSGRTEGLVGDTHGKLAYVVFLDEGEMDWLPCDALVRVPDAVEEAAPVPAPAPGGGGGGGVSAAVTKCQRGCNSRCNGAQNKSKCVNQCRRDCAG